MTPKQQTSKKHRTWITQRLGFEIFQPSPQIGTQGSSPYPRTLTWNSTTQTHDWDSLYPFTTNHLPPTYSKLWLDILRPPSETATPLAQIKKKMKGTVIQFSFNTKCHLFKLHYSCHWTEIMYWNIWLLQCMQWSILKRYLIKPLREYRKSALPLETWHHAESGYHSVVALTIFQIPKPGRYHYWLTPSGCSNAKNNWSELYL